MIRKNNILSKNMKQLKGWNFKCKEQKMIYKLLNKDKINQMNLIDLFKINYFILLMKIKNNKM